jgi:hypothetical protein
MPSNYLTVGAVVWLYGLETHEVLRLFIAVLNVCRHQQQQQ